jgi:hypothetical protein
MTAFLRLRFQLNSLMPPYQFRHLLAKLSRVTMS